MKAPAWAAARRRAGTAPIRRSRNRGTYPAGAPPDRRGVSARSSVRTFGRKPGTGTRMEAWHAHEAAAIRTHRTSLPRVRGCACLDPVCGRGAGRASNREGRPRVRAGLSCNAAAGASATSSQPAASSIRLTPPEPVSSERRISSRQESRTGTAIRRRGRARPPATVSAKALSKSPWPTRAYAARAGWGRHPPGQLIPRRVSTPRRCRSYSSD